MQKRQARSHVFNLSVRGEAERMGGTLLHHSLAASPQHAIGPERDLCRGKVSAKGRRGGGTARQATATLAAEAVARWANCTQAIAIPADRASRRTSRKWSAGQTGRPASSGSPNQARTWPEPGPNLGPNLGPCTLANVPQVLLRHPCNAIFTPARVPRGPVAQRIEQRASNAKVAGSSPAGTATYVSGRSLGPLKSSARHPLGIVQTPWCPQRCAKRIGIAGP